MKGFLACFLFFQNAVSLRGSPLSFLVFLIRDFNSNPTLHRPEDSFSIAAWDVKIKKVIETSKHSLEHNSICSCIYCPSFQFLLPFCTWNLNPSSPLLPFLLSAVCTSTIFFYFCFLNIYRRKSPCYLDLPSFHSPISLFFLKKKSRWKKKMPM